MREALPVILLFLPIVLALLLRLRPRQGVLSARRTPTRPPAPARLVPLETRGGIRGCGKPPTAPPPKPADSATSARPYPR